VCCCTVWVETDNSSAICAVESPRRTSLVTSCSRSVNPYADMSRGVSPVGSADRRTPVEPWRALNAVHFAWAGPTVPGEPHYYRLQGPRLLTEWDNTQSNANHARSVWRDPTSDFGLDVLARHRAAHHV
jgi:hypothetical protein